MYIQRCTFNKGQAALTANLGVGIASVNTDSLPSCYKMGTSIRVCIFQRDHCLWHMGHLAEPLKLLPGPKATT